MTNRARDAARTGERIVEATEALLTTESIADVTLQAIASRSGVTVQTVLRHMGSRDGCFAAVGERLAARVDAQRTGTEPGDVAAAVAALVGHYEAEGRLILNLLSQEGSDDAFARTAAEAGRAYHRAWVVRCFGRVPPDDLYGIDALVAATDLYVWKLLRLDLERSTQATEAVITRLVRSILEAS
jgi:AcrR family transcriptional regulator